MIYRFILCCWLLCLVSTADAAEKYIQVEDIARSDGGYDLVVSNRDVIPHFLTLHFNELKNLQVDQTEPFQFTVPAHAKQQPLLRLTTINPRQSYGFSYRSTDVQGKPNATHDDSYLYTFPYAHGTKHQIVQGYFGSFTHQTQYALDFDMPVGTAVMAARDGIVSATEASYDVAGTDVSFKQYANYVRIYHDDGSIASYVHLRQGGVVVQRGQHVKVGQLLGYSGNTGQSSGPHLHFAVHIPVPSATNKTVPIQFINHDLRSVKPEEMRYYYSHHTDLPAFPIHLGRTIQNDDYLGYQKPIAYTGEINMREEKIDSTTLVFIQNGTDVSMNVDVFLHLSNMQCSKPNPLVFQVPPQTEIFAYTLRPQKAAAYSYSSQYQFSKSP